MSAADLFDGNGVPVTTLLLFLLNLIDQRLEIWDVLLWIEGEWSAYAQSLLSAHTIPRTSSGLVHCSFGRSRCKMDCCIARLNRNARSYVSRSESRDKACMCRGARYVA